MKKTFLLGLVLFLGGIATAHAQSASTADAPVSAPSALAGQGQQSDRVAKLEQQVVDARGSGDNAWMLVSSALGAAQKLVHIRGKIV